MYVLQRVGLVLSGTIVMRWKLRHVFAKQSAAKVTDGVRIYAIGDVHGCNSILQHLLVSIDAHLRTFPSQRPILVFLGDYVDRGPGSREAIDRLISLRKHREAIFLKGNHESYLLEFLKRPAILTKWIQFGALETLRSYGLSPGNHLNSEEQESLAAALHIAMDKTGHLEFIDCLQTSFVCDDFFFAHAGVRPGIPLDRQREDDLLWIREEFLQYKGDLGKIIVHGHTPVTQPEVRSNRINIDTGAYATGRMTCLVIEQDKMKFISSA
jgi:serine/threonine protein phosphatase 1